MQMPSHIQMDSRNLIEGKYEGKCVSGEHITYGENGWNQSTNTIDMNEHKKIDKKISPY